MSLTSNSSKNFWVQLSRPLRYIGLGRFSVASFDGVFASEEKNLGGHNTSMFVIESNSLCDKEASMPVLLLCELCWLTSWLSCEAESFLRERCRFALLILPMSLEDTLF
jgi:hypothetical protein